MAQFTQEQQAAIEAKGKTIVSASAGSGKTTVMIEKIIRLIKGGTNVDEILAVTFTKKAAAQMKEKLSKALIETINSPDTTEEKKRALKKQLSDVPTADISTIHSFCGDLLRQYAYMTDLSADFRVADENECQEIQIQVLDQLLCERFRDVIKDVIYADAVVHHLNQIRHLHRLEGLPDLSFPEDALHLTPGQPVAGHPGG